MQVQLSGAVALVTGGAGGIGAAIAAMLEDAGAAVAISDLASAADGRPSALRLAHDVTSAEDWSAVVRAVETTLGPITILCNSAGIRPPIEDVDRMSRETWQRTFDVNATGCLLGYQAVLPGMKQRRHGKIVNVASTVGKETPAGSAAYGASKHAVIGLTQSAAFEAGPYDVNVNAVCPGAVETPLLVPAGDPEGAAALVARLGALAPLGRLAEPRDVAALVTFLCSEHARNIQGQAINVDAGRSTHT